MDGSCWVHGAVRVPPGRYGELCNAIKQLGARAPSYLRMQGWQWRCGPSDVFDRYAHAEVEMMLGRYQLGGSRRVAKLAAGLYEQQRERLEGLLGVARLCSHSPKPASCTRMKAQAARAAANIHESNKWQ
jgi:hypothetical protein